MHHLPSSFTTRRDVLRGMAGLGLLALTGSSAHAQSGADLLKTDPDLAKLIDGIIGVDLHSHSGGLHFRKKPEFDVAQRMREGHLTAAALCHTGDGPVITRADDRRIVTKRQPTPNELWEHTLERLNFFDRMVKDQGFRRMLKPGDLQLAKRDGVAGMVQAVEGCQFLEGKLERIGAVYARGVRHLQMLHFFKSDLGENQTENRTSTPLTSAGKDAIAECNRLGIVVDVAHATQAFVEEAAAVCRTPLILSHSSIAAKVSYFSRHITPEHAKIVAQTGGVVGIWTLSASFKTLSEWVDGVARAVDVVGADHVGIGSDMGGEPPNLYTDYRNFPLMVQLLKKRGFSAAEIGKIAGGNYVRVFDLSTRAAS